MTVQSPIQQVCSFLFTGFEHQNSSSLLQAQESWETGIVSESIEPDRAGRVQFQGSWWPAVCENHMTMTLTSGEIVRVVGRRNLTLIVQPMN